MKKIFLFMAAGLFFLATNLFGSDIQIVAVVEKDVLSIGESFIYQIQIKGSDQASGFPEDEWSDSKFKNNFNVEFLGGQNNSSRQVSIINGRRKEIINTAYIISWSLTPLTAGTLIIPSLTLTIEGDKYSTRPIKIESKEAEESENFELKVTLDKDTAFVGEPLLVTFTWYIGMNIKDFNYSVPFFQNSNFTFLDSSDTNPDPSNLIQFPVDGVTVMGEQGKGTFKGKTFTTVTFSKLVIPKVPGQYNIPKSVISVSAEISSRGRGSDLFSSFFSSFSPEYAQFTVPSNDLSLNVKALPSLGKPDNFNGYIGELNIETSASPLDVRVGDPITLTMKISGPKNIADWDAPDLNKQYELSANFKMPSSISAGKIDGDSIVFTQTIRSLNDTVTQIPPLEIPYFDAEKGIYSIASSKAIPITVAKGSAVRMEGSDISNSNDMQQDIVLASNNGINFNYEDIDIQKSQKFGLKVLTRFPIILALIIFPLVFLVVLVLKLTKKRNYFNGKNNRKKTLSEFKKDLKEIKSNLGISSQGAGGKINILFKKFMSSKISTGKEFVSEEDLKTWLVNKNLKIDDFPLIFELFTILDELQYAGVLLKDTDYKLQIESLIDKVLLAVEDFEGRV